jgi:RHS repeat-associated protein
VGRATYNQHQIREMNFEVRNSFDQSLVFSRTIANPPPTNLAGPPWNAEASVTTSALPVGVYELRITARDSARQVGEAISSFTVRVPNLPPSVSVVAPTTGSFLAPATITFEASASDADGTVQSVYLELRNTGSNAIVASSSISAPPYRLQANNLPVGTYRLLARAVDDRGAPSEFNRDINVVSNLLPTVVLVAPITNTVAVVPATVLLQATAADADGSIDSVEFLRHGPNGAIPIGTGVLGAAGSYSFNWQNVAIGSHTIIARARDNRGATVDSESRLLQVRLNTLPQSGAMIKPAVAPEMIRQCSSLPPYQCPDVPKYTKNIFAVGQLMRLEASFNDIDGNIDRVEFRRHAPLTGPSHLLATVRPSAPGLTQFTAAAEVVLTDSMADYRMQTIHAVAFDTAGVPVETLHKAPVAIHRTSALSTPCSGSEPGCIEDDVPHPVPGVLHAERYDLGGAGVSYFDLDPYVVASSGSYTPRFDDVDLRGCGDSGLSEDCVVGRRQPGEWLTWSVAFNEPGRYWFYLCETSDASTLTPDELAANTRTAADEPFDVGISFSGQDPGVSPDYEFGLHLEPSSESDLINLRQNAARGGVQLPDCSGTMRQQLIPGNFPRDYTGRMTWENYRVQGQTGIWGFHPPMDWIALLPDVNPGDNLSIEIAQPLTGAVIPYSATAPSSVPVRATVVSMGASTSVSFYYRNPASNNADILIGSDHSPPYEVSWTPSILGEYRLSARADTTINQPISVTSAIVNVTVSNVPQNQPPQTALLQPSAGNVEPGKSLDLRASALDVDGTVSRVEFLIYRGGQQYVSPIPAVADSAVPGQWKASWTTPQQAGSYHIRSRAFDSGSPQTTGISPTVVLNVQAIAGLDHETPAAIPSSVEPGSDGVGATAGSFRVDETGAATYSIPLAVVPGRAGVAPEMALTYSSQGGMGVMGRGWSIAGASAITRCRQTAEAGDIDALAAGSPPLSFGASDRYCLDGQRLMLVAGSYESTAASMEFRTEIDSFARIRAFNTDGVNGPNYFVVQAKDGTTSWYGDSINGQGLPFMAGVAAVPRTDAVLRRNDGSGQTPAASAPILAFGLARRMDSFGNYVDHQYQTDQTQGEQVLTRVEYTGKTTLNGQTGSAQAAFAALRFNYENLPVAQERAGWQSGMRVRSTKRLTSVDSLANLSSNQVIRQYRLGYGLALAVSGERVLNSIAECSGIAADAVCYKPTTFGWSQGSLRVDDFQTPTLLYHTRADVKAHQVGDVDGDGLMDLVWFNNDENYGGPCSSLLLPTGTQRIVTGFGSVLSAPAAGPASPTQFGFPVSGSAACSLRSYSSLSGAWYLFDYNGDGRDDLMLADKEPESNQDVTSWQVYASRGRVGENQGQVFNQGLNGNAGLLATCPRDNPATTSTSEADPDSPNCLPVNRGEELLMQLVDLNGDSLQDAVYGSPILGASGQNANVIKFKLLEQTSQGQRFSRAYSANFALSGNEYLDDCSGGGGPPTDKKPLSVQSCKIRFLDANSRAGRSPTPVDLNGDGRGDLLVQVQVDYQRYDPNNLCRTRTEELPVSTASMFAPKDAADLARLLAASDQRRGAICSNEGTHFFTVAAAVSDIDHQNRTVKLDAYWAFDGDHFPPPETEGPSRGRAQPRPADFNGDGLVDLVFNHPFVEDRIQVSLNTGDGFVDLAEMAGITARDHIQLLDFDGDGRTDLLHPSGSGDNSVWQLRRGQPEGGISPNVILPDFWVPDPVAGQPNRQARLDFRPGRSLFFFSDFDGDGKTDVLEVPGPDSSDHITRMIRSGVSQRYKPLANISTITNGYGAVTEITYQPLTNGAVYLREPGSRAQSQSIGNGSPVQDLLGGMYVVSRVASDAPGLGAATRKSELFYQYRGGRMQAGGRGMLGFREVRTIDANFEPGTSGAQRHMVSITEYGLSATDTEAGVVRYGFPYIGIPRETRQYRVDGAVPTNLRSCLLSGPESVAGYCFNAGGLTATPNPYFVEPSGTLLSFARNRLNSAVTVTGPGGESSVFAYIEASFEAKGNPEFVATGKFATATLSETVNKFSYLTEWGDLGASDVGTSSGATYSNVSALRTAAIARMAASTLELRCAGSTRCVTSVATVNTWLASSQPTAATDRDYWRLGRLEKSTVTHWRQGAHGEQPSSLTRESRFQYELGAPTRTGALTVERVAGLSTASSATAPNGSDSELRTVRKRDTYGNVTDTFVCSGDVSDSDCENASKVLQRQRPAGINGAPLTRVHRYTRTEYDAQGRYPVRTLAPHYADAAPGGVLYALESVEERDRDALGNVLQTSRLNGGGAIASYGVMGRQQTSEDSTGSKSLSEFHWCAGGSATGQVAACPSDIGAVFRQTSYSYGGTRSVTYFDRLGREVFALSEGFNRFDNNAANDWVGVCKTYDGRGRTVAVTEPFFVSNIAFSGLRPELSTEVSCTSRASTRTTYDELDRALTILLPEHGGTTTAMSQMVYAGLQTTTTTRLSRATSPFVTPTVVELSEVKLHDATGQVLSVTDAENLTANYAHDATGNLIALKRDAGRGEIVSRISYDALGRKTSQNDPDAGTASYAYNAAGELICSQDARGYATITDFDALGRSWRSRTQGNGCPAPTIHAFVPDTAEASTLTTEYPGTHASVDVTVYDLAANGKGQIASSERKHRVGIDYSGYGGNNENQGFWKQAVSYDTQGRPFKSAVSFKEPNFSGTGLRNFNYEQITTFDDLGRVATSRDATSRDATTGVVENMYSAHGFLRRVRDAGQPSLVFWELLETDARGQTTLDRRHGNVELTQQRQYNPVTGRLARIVTGTWANGQVSSAVQNLSYIFDAQGNLLSRKDERANGREEVFIYDRLNRLIEARLNGTSPAPANGLPTLTLSYDKLGNICSKNGVGYSYAGRAGCGLNGVGGSGGTGSASPHAVTARGSLGYQYDLAGNMTTTTGGTHGTRTVRFDGAGNADRLAISTQSTSFWYAGGGRYLRLDESSEAPAKLTRYLGSVEWILRSNGAEERKRNIGGFLLLTETGDQAAPTRKYRYLLADHLGSTDTLVDENGVVHERMSFDAHGSRRSADSGTGMWASLLPAVAPTDINPQVNAETTRGFTGHEHIDRMGLVHMNGRLYDPLLGRMLSPDPIVQEPYNAQNLNRYSYVLNNPLSYTDPSGLSFVKKYWRAIVATAVSIFMPMLAPGFWGAVATGFVSGTIATGSWEGGLWGAFSAGVFYGIGTHFQDLAKANVAAGNTARTIGETGLTSTQFAGKVLSHATAGGVMSAMQGGKFGHGFASAGITQAFAPGIDRIDVSNAGFSAARVMAAAMVGGTASVASGGKFANGAITGAFSRAFNDESHRGWVDDLVEYGPGFASDAVVGFGEGVFKAITFGFGDLAEVRDAMGIGPYHGDEIVMGGARTVGGIQGGFALGGALGLVGRGRAGWQWSHWVPDRYIRQLTPGGRANPYYKTWLDNLVGKSWMNSSLNGTGVPTLVHRLTDKFAYRFMPASSKALWGRVSPVPQGAQQLLRTPPWVVGAGLGATAGD